MTLSSLASANLSSILWHAVTAWIVAVAWIVAGDNSCRCSRHKSSPATIHAVSVSMNCRRRQFMPEISLMLCTSPATIHAAWKKSSAYIVAVGIFWRHRGLYLFIFFLSIYCFFFIWLRFKWIFCVIRHTQINQTRIILKTYFMII